MSKTVDELLELMKKEFDEFKNEMIELGFSEEEIEIKFMEALVKGFNMSAEKDGLDIRFKIKENK